MSRNVKGFNPNDPKNRQRCVDDRWKKDRHVRILHPAFGYKGKIAEIKSVGPERVCVRIILDRHKPDGWTEVSYSPEDLKLI